MTERPLDTIGFAPGAWPFIGIGLLIGLVGLGIGLYGERRSGRRWNRLTALGLAIALAGILVMSLRRTS